MVSHCIYLSKDNKTQSNGTSTPSNNSLATPLTSSPTSLPALNTTRISTPVTLPSPVSSPKLPGSPNSSDREIEITSDSEELKQPMITEGEEEKNCRLALEQAIK